MVSAEEFIKYMNRGGHERALNDIRVCREEAEQREEEYYRKLGEEIERRQIWRPRQRGIRACLGDD